MLDRLATVAVASLHDSGVRGAVPRPGADNWRLLHRDRLDDMVQE